MATSKWLPALVSSILLWASPARAWWDYGHQTIAAIAMKVAKPETRRKVDALLARHRLLETPTCPAHSLEAAAVWADCIKVLGPRFDYAFAWHYQNADICKPFDLTASCADGHCVTRQVERNAKLLADKSLPVRERVMALAFLAHFVGDLHMPLHAGDRGDRGGNDRKAAYGIVEGRLNLHLIWDGPLAERAITTPPSGASGLLREATPEMSVGSVADWSRESWQVARDHAYATANGGDPCAPGPTRARLDDVTIERLVPVVRRQLLRAGIRLARLLDEALAPSR